VSKRWRWLGSAVLLGLVAWRMDWNQVGAAFGRMHWPLWAAGLGLFLMVQAVSSLRWQLLARGLGFGGSTARYLGDYFVGMFFNLVLPTSVGGDVVRAWRLAQHEGPAPASGRRTAAALSVLADRVSGVLVLVALAGVATALCPVPLPAWIATTVAALAVGGVLGLAALPVLRRLLDAAPQSLRLARVRRVLATSSKLLRQPGLLFGTTLLSFVVQAVNALIVGVLGLGLGLEVPALYYGVLVPLVALLTLVPISLNGMGLREFGTVALLAPLGVSSADALTLSLLTFAVYTAAGACGGLALLAGGPRPSATLTAESDEPVAQAG
jgi:uncharacterized membrane protein YbhN (UPF0104 family)